MPEYSDDAPSLLDPQTIENLLHHLESTDVDELEVVQGDARIYLRREPGRRFVLSGEDDVSTGPTATTDSAITAPLTGVYYGRPSPEQAAFVAEGDTVEPGQVVALIETMKLFNEVTAELFGEVTRIAVADNDLVELGQPLMYVRPGEAGEAE